MSTPERWIVIDRWDDFQHPDAGRSGVTPWIKSYTRLLSNDDFLELSHHIRGVLFGLWLEYARARRQLGGSPVALTRRLGQRVTTRDLDTLNHAGFIHFVASKPQAERKQPASLEVEVEKKDLARARATPKSKPTETNPYACPRDGLRFALDRQLIDHLYDAHNLKGPELVQTLHDLDIPLDLIPEHIPGSPAYISLGAHQNAEVAAPQPAALRSQGDHE